MYVMNLRKLSAAVIFFIPFLMGLSSIALKDIETAIIERNYPQVETLVQSFIAQNPNKDESDAAQYYLGLSLLYLSKYSQAREVFDQLIEYKPQVRLRDKASIAIIDSYYLQEHYHDAVERAHALLKSSPQSEFESLVYLKLARANLRLARWDEAQKYLKKIVGSFPNSLEAHAAKQLLEEKQNFSVQIGAFLERERAEQAAEKIKQKDEYAFIVETVDSSGRKFYRVRVGQLSLLKDAKELKKKLANLGYPSEVYP